MATSVTASSLAQTSEPKDDGITSMEIDDDDNDGDDDSPLLVSEFAPPPYYYRLAANTTMEQSSLQPPAIPTEALQRAARKSASMAAEAKEIAERNRLQAANSDMTDNSNNHNNNEASSRNSSDNMNQVALGGAVPDLNSTLDDDGDIVAVFGEIVEDPLLVQVEDDEDPTKIRDAVSRLNNQVLQGFAKLVGELVYRPLENKNFRDELSHKIFLMIQECNKFREHQARETLIELLEHQLVARNKALKELEKQIQLADESIEQCKNFQNKRDHE